MIFVYCKTTDNPKRVGKLICRANCSKQNKDSHSWSLKDDSESCIVETDCKDSAVAMIYRIGRYVIVVEVDGDYAPNVIEPLLKEYGFENTKWLQAS